MLGLELEQVRGALAQARHGGGWDRASAPRSTPLHRV
jgi:hypothetical protein